MMNIHETSHVSDFAYIIGTGSLIVREYSIIEPHVLIDLGVSGEVLIGSRSKLKYGSVIRSYDGSISIGNRTTIGEYSILSGHGGLKIGDAVIISGHCYLSASDHIIRGKDHIRFQGEIAKGILIDDGAWIGARCVVLDGVHLGLGSVIGAGSVVTNSMRNNMVCYGSPCREMRERSILTEEIK